MVVKRRSSAKYPPIFSHEFIIQNHADIVACTAILFAFGLMFPLTSPIASMFFSLSHNATLSIDGSDALFYTAGIKDFAAIFFYLLVTIVAHQVFQEYVLDKINRKLHLSKVKFAKFNESGQLLIFYITSLIWSVDILIRLNMFNSLRILWEGYPHVHMTFILKFFYIVQMSYWIHILPELYFQKVKKEDMGAKIQYAFLYLAFIGVAYYMSFTRVALCLLILDYVSEALLHVCRLLNYADKRHLMAAMYKLHSVVFVIARLGSISLAVLTFRYGLALAPKESQIVDTSVGAFNTPIVRMVALVSVCLLQAYLMWNFVIHKFNLRKQKEKSVIFSSSGTRGKKSQQAKAKERKERKRENYDESDLTEVDQNTKKEAKINLRQRK